MAGDERRLGSRYTLVEPIGRGATGEVWRASAEGERRPVAVKLLRADLRGDPEIVARFLQERSVMLQLRHPNVVRVRDLVAEGDRLAIMMDLVDGTNLRQLLRQRRTLPPSVACTLASGIASGLAAAHAAGVVHRDLKPENVLVTEDPDRAPVALVTDFGLAKLVHGSSVTRLTQVIGTPGYMAPELGAPGPRTAAVDVYALGVLLYELLTGRRPFDADHPLAVLRAHVEQAPSRPADLADELWELLGTCLAKDPNERPAAAGLVDRLDGLAASLRDAPALAPEQATAGGAVTSLGTKPTRVKGAGRPATSASKRRPAWRRRGVLLPALTALVVLAGAGLWAGATPGKMMGAMRPVIPGSPDAPATTASTRPPPATTTTPPGRGPTTVDGDRVPDPPGRPQPSSSAPPSPSVPGLGPPTPPSPTRPPVTPPKRRVMYHVWQPSAPGKGHPHPLDTYQWAGQAFLASAPVLQTIRLNLAYSDGGGDVRVFLFHGRHAHEDLVDSKIVRIRQNATTDVNFGRIPLAVGDRYVVQVFMLEHGAVYFSNHDEVPSGTSYSWCPGSNAEACRHPEHDMNMEVVGWSR